MKRIFLFLLALGLVLSAAASAEEGRADFAVSMIEALAAGKYDTVEAASDPALIQAVAQSGGYASVWAQITSALGTFVECTGAEDSGDAVLVYCDFAQTGAVLSVGVTQEMRLSGLILSDLLPQEDAEDVQEDGSYVEEEVIFRSGEEDETGATLTFPEGDGPFPAVLLVPGSGAADRDASAYGLTPFRDLARGLARRGIASIRYDKYSYAHPELLQADCTIEREYLLDTRAALDALLSDSRISRVFVLGHSQGAMLGPRILEDLLPHADGRLAGGILLAGTPKHLWEIQYRQNLDLLDLTEKAYSSEQLAEMGVDLNAQRAQLEAEVQKIDCLETEETFFGLPASYQADEMRVDAAQAAIENGLPLWIGQGAKDWQVLPEEGLEAWKGALAGSDLDVSYHLYPDMNHLLIDMEGEPTYSVEDYLVPGAHVDENLIEDLATWIFSIA